MVYSDAWLFINPDQAVKQLHTKQYDAYIICILIQFDFLARSWLYLPQAQQLYFACLIHLKENKKQITTPAYVRKAVA